MLLSHTSASIPALLSSVSAEAECDQLYALPG